MHNRRNVRNSFQKILTTIFIAYFICGFAQTVYAFSSGDSSHQNIIKTSNTIQSYDNYLYFDGGDRVIIPNNPSLNPSQITVETWVKFNAISTGANAEFLICKGGDRTTGAYILAQGMAEDNTFGFEIAPFSSLLVINTPPLSLETNTWYHVAGTYDGNTLRIYVGGILQGSKDIGSVQVGNSSPLYFSYNGVAGYNYYLNGGLKEVRIWNTARSESEIQADMNNTLVGNEPGLAGYWRLDEGSGQIVHDYSSNGNNGQLGSTSGIDADDPKWFSGAGWSDDFESYTLGTFPSSGGWILRYSGADASSQYIDNTHSVSGLLSLHLVGSSCWSGEAYHTIDVPYRVRLETMVFVDKIVSCGCTPAVASVRLLNPALGTWGTGFGEVMFQCDSNIYAVQDTYDRGKDKLLMPYDASRWYHVELDIDLSTRLFDVYIDGFLRGSGFQILNSGMPTGINIAAGHGGNPRVWFDDVKVTSLTGTQQQYTLTVGKAGTGIGDITANTGTINWSGNSGTATYNSNTPVTLTASASTGSTFTSWSGCDSTNGNQCTVMMNTAKSVTATFTLNPTQQHTLTITKLGTGNGRITSSPSGIDCGSVCLVKYDHGTVVTLTPVADAGSIFTGWSGGGYTGTGLCVTTLNADTTITATFTAQVGTPKISVSPKSINFGSIGTGNTSDPKPITIKNKGKGYLVIDSIIITGTNASEFSQTNNCSTISPGDSCTVNVTFNPTSSSGKESATLSIASNDPKNPTVNVKLTGQVAPKISIEGTWNVQANARVKVSIGGHTQTRSMTGPDQFTFSSDGSFAMTDMDGTWSQNGRNFSINLDPQTVSNYFADNLSGQLGSDVSVEVTTITFTGTVQKNGTIKGSFKLNMNIDIQDSGLQGTVTASVTFRGTLLANSSTSSVKKHERSQLTESILNMIKEELNKTVQSPDSMLFLK